MILSSIFLTKYTILPLANAGKLVAQVSIPAVLIRNTKISYFGVSKYLNKTCCKEKVLNVKNAYIKQQLKIQLTLKYNLKKETTYPLISSNEFHPFISFLLQCFNNVFTHKLYASINIVFLKTRKLIAKYS